MMTRNILRTASLPRRIGQQFQGILSFCWGLTLCLFLSSITAHSAGNEVRRRPIQIPKPDPQAAKVPSGFQVEVMLANLTGPTSIEFDDEGNTYVAEAGFKQGEVFVKPALWRISPAGDSVLVTDQLDPPVNDLLWVKGRLYISHWGKISVLETNKIVDLVTGLPSLGDYQNNQMTLGPDGKIYFGQGTASNSGIVGLDNWAWVPEHPEFHDYSAKDISLRAVEVTTWNPFGRDRQALVNTAAYHAFGQTLFHAGTLVPGQTKASGTILRMNPDGTQLEVYAWGLRNPFGVLWRPDPDLFVTEQGFQVRGSRPIANDQEDLYVISPGAWYGWPDYASGIPVSDPRFTPTNGSPATFLLVNHPPVQKPWLSFPDLKTAMKLEFSPNNMIGGRGDILVAFFGQVLPEPEQDPAAESHTAVALINRYTRRYEEFFSSKPMGTPGFVNGRPIVTAGPRRLIDARFSPQGDALYVVDFGLLEYAASGMFGAPGSGVVWKISRASEE